MNRNGEKCFHAKSREKCCEKKKREKSREKKYESVIFNGSKRTP